MKKKRAILIVSCLIVFITGVLATIIIFNNHDKKIYTTKYMDELPQEMLAIMIQNSDGTYSTSSSSSFNTSGYRLNKTKSYCINGGKLEYEISTQKVKATTSGEDKCFVYLDIYTKTLADKIVEDNGGYTAVHAKTLTKDGISEAAPKYKTTITTQTTNGHVAYAQNSNLWWIFGSGYTLDEETGIYKLTDYRTCVLSNCNFLTGTEYFFDLAYSTEAEAKSATSTKLSKLTSVDTSNTAGNYPASYETYTVNFDYTEQISESQNTVFNSSKVYYLQESYTFDSTTGLFTVTPTMQATTSTITTLGKSGMYYYIDDASSSMAVTKKRKLYKLTSKPTKVGTNITANVAELTAIPSLDESSSGLFTACANIENYRNNTCAEDGYTYFFRGHVNNNWISFAGMYWRIVRVNPDSTIKLIYAGQNAPTESTQYNGTALLDGSTKFSSSADSGYGQVASSSSSSLAKQNSESFYTAHFYQTTYADYLSDQIFDTPYIGTTLANIPSTGEKYNVTTQVVKNKYGIYGPNGNGRLTYKIGLLSVTEAQMVGLNTTKNSTRENNYSNYLYNRTGTWLMPYELSSTVYLHAVDDEGILQYQEDGDSSLIYSDTYKTRPVINLVSNVTYSGTGAYNDPYIITGLS